MKKWLVLLLLPLVFIGATYKSREVNHDWKFNNDEVLEDIDAVSGLWVIVTPEKLQQPLLSQTVKYADFPKALIRGRDFFDFEISTRMYLSSESEDTQSGGLILRYRNLYSYYMLFLNTKDKRLTLTRAGLGGLKVLKRENREFSPDRWYELKAVCYLDRIQAFVDGQLIIDAKDETSTGGKIGLVTAGTSLIYFEDLKVKTEAIEASRQETAQKESE